MGTRKKIGRTIANLAGGMCEALTARDDAALYETFYETDTLKRRPFYNVGAGGFQHPHWTNVDHPSDWYAKRQSKASMIPWDMLELSPLPVEDAVAEVVYTSHALEHVSDAAAANFFQESFRILRPGALLRVTMPDMGLAYRALLREDRHFFADFAMPAGASLEGTPLYELFLARFATSTTQLWSSQGPAPRITEAEFVEWFKGIDAPEGPAFQAAMDKCIARTSLGIQRTHPGNHLNWWTEEKVLRFIADAGFAGGVRSGYGQSECAILRNTHHFDSTRPTISLYAEAVHS